MNPIQNQLAKNPTKWPIWFAIFPFVATIVSALLSGVLSIGGPDSLLSQLNPLIQIALLAVISIALVWAFSRKYPTASDLGYGESALTKKNLIIVISVFVVTHLLFYILGKVGGVQSDAVAEFKNGGFGTNFQTDLILITAGSVFAPIFEELVYRGVMFRSFHDGLLRFFPNSKSIAGIPSLLAIAFTAIAFILPHVSNLTFGVMTLAYFITSAGFSLVFLTTGSMVAAMVSHSLQSCVAFMSILVYGHGSYNLSPIIYGIALFCPVIVYFLGSAIGKLFPKVNR